MGRDGKWRLLRWRNEGLRRAAGGVMRRKWWSAWELRGVARRGCRRKWWFAGREENGEVALKAIRLPSRWRAMGYGGNAGRQLDMTLVRDANLRTL
jgi:hypothetical protein